MATGRSESRRALPRRPRRQIRQAAQRLAEQHRAGGIVIARPEHCPVSPWVFAHPSGDRLTDLRGSFKAAGITDFHIHGLRYTFTSWLVQVGVSLAEIRDLLGHKTVSMTERYAHAAPENLRSATDRLAPTGHLTRLATGKG